MRKFILISFFISILSVTVFISSFFVYPNQMQNFIIKSFNLKTYLNQKVQNFIEKKINNENVNVNIEKIKFLKPDWANIAKIELSNVNITSIKQKGNSKIKFIELGFSFDKIFKNLFLNKDQIQFSYINFRDLTLNARIEKDEFIPGPLVKIFSSINNNYIEKQSSIKTILNSKIIIGKIKFLLIDNADLLNERSLEIDCENVLISELINNSRSVLMDCNKRKNNYFSLRAILGEDLNIFSGYLKNINPNLFLNNKIVEKFSLLKLVFNNQIHINGTYNIKTSKNFDLQSVNIISNDSILISSNEEDIEILKTKLNGVLSWEKKVNLLKYSNVNLGNQLVANGEIDLKSKKGYSNFSIKKISIKDSKNYLNKYLNFYSSPFGLSINKTLNRLVGGNLKNLSINVKFSLLKEIIVKNITGLSHFSNIRFEHSDKTFKKILSTISGNFEFGLNPKKTSENYLDFKLIASDGFILFNNHKLKYTFNKANITGKFNYKKQLFSKADFYKKNNLEYSFRNVEINGDNYHVSRAEYLKNNEIRYAFHDTKIKNLNVIKSFLKIKNNPHFNNFIKRKFNIQIIGDTEIDVFFSGDLKKLNFNLKLETNLKNSYIKIEYLNIAKKKNISSLLKSEISLLEGKISSLQNLILTINHDIYKIDLVDFKNTKTSEILIKNVRTPDQNIDKILLSRNSEVLNIFAYGKKIDLSNIKEKMQKNTKKNKVINLDLTSDLIKLNPKISLIGNLNGKIKKSFFKSTAYGKILLDGLPIMDNGKFNIQVDDMLSSLEGLGLVGGAETKINLYKKKNNFPNLIFDTSDGGKLLNVLGITKNIKSGDMNININFLNDSYNDYNGHIKSKKFSIINAPGIINSLSVLSFSGIGSIISGEGVFFDKGQAVINVKDKIIKFDKLHLTSESLGISARGKLDREKKSIDLMGSVAPIKLISRIISVVPAVGELLTGLKKEGLFAGQFRMSGLIKNPDIKLNTMSFAPGILRDLFSDDWLDNNNIFIK